MSMGEDFGDLRDDEVSDPVLIEWAEEMADRVRAGLPVDWEGLARRDPGRAERLRRMLPAVELMAGLGASAVREAAQPRLAPPDAGPFDEPSRLGDFHLRRLVGCGGMGVVYEAEQVSLGRRVALKVLPFAAALDPRQLQRFRVEAQAAACLHHTNIVPVHAVGSERGVPYYAMQFIEGLSLASVIRQRRRIEGLMSARSADGLEEGTTRADFLPLGATVVRSGAAAPPAIAAALPESPRDAPPGSSGGSTRDRSYHRMAAGLALQAAEALDHAHERGIVHRDIKPGNLLLDAEGRLWVADFGLAQIKGDRGLTLSGDILGTLRYMSPEQATGRRAALDGRTDVYSLGASLYELLTLRPPFDGRDRAEVLRRVAREEPVPPRRLNAAVPADLETIVLKAMAKEPQARYATARELAADLRRFLEDRPIRARRPSLPDRAAKWAKRHRAVVAAGLALLVPATATLVAILAWSNARQQRVIAQLQSETARANQHEREAQRQRRLAERHELAAQMALAQRSIATGEFGRAREVLGSVRHIPDPSDPRELAWRAVWNAAHRVITIGEDDGRGALCLTASPDGSTLASLDPRRPEIHLRDRETGRLRATLAVPGEVSQQVGLVFSPDGRRLAAHSGVDGSPCAWIWEVASGSLLAEVRAPSGEPPIGWIGLLAGGRFLTIHHPATGETAKVVLWALDLDSKATPRRVATLSRASYYDIAPPEGRTVAIRERGRLVLFDALDGSPRLVIPRPTGPPPSSTIGRAFPREGEALVEIEEGAVRCFDTAAGSETRIPFDPSWPPERVSFLPRGRVLVFADREQGVVTLRRDDGPALTLRPETPDAPDDISALAAPDGQTLAVLTCSARRVFQPITLWDIASGRRIATCPEGIAKVTAAAFTPDSRGLIIQDGEDPRLWRLDEPDAVAGHSDEAWSVAFSPDGRLLATGSDDDEPESIKLWDPSSGRLVRAWAGGAGTVAALAFSPDGLVLASAHLEDEKPDKVRLWDAATGRPLGALSGHTGRVRALAFSPDGSMLASAGSDPAARLWDVASRRCLHLLPGHARAVQDLAFSADGETVASAGGDGLRLWDVATGRLRSMRADEGLMAVAFSADGATLATADEEGWVVLYDRDSDRVSGRPRAAVEVAVGDLNALAFHPAGGVLAVAGQSGMIHILDPATGDEWPGLEGPRVQINGLAFSPDGSTLASASHDGAVKLWRTGLRPATGPSSRAPAR